MPLSEDEQRILQDIERNFYEQDPSFARAVSHPVSYEKASRNCKFSAIGFAVGLAVVIGTFTSWPVVAFVGFLLMLGAAAFFVANIRRIAEANQLKVADLESSLAADPLASNPTPDASSAEHKSAAAERVQRWLKKRRQ